MAGLALRLSTSELNEMFVEVQRQTGAACQVDQHELVYSLQQPFGRVAYRCTHLRHGITLTISQLDLTEELQVVLQTQVYSALEFSFCLAGEFQGQYSGYGEAQFAGPGKSYTNLTQGCLTVTNSYSPKHPVSVLTISFAPSWLEDAAFAQLTKETLGKTIHICTDELSVLGTIDHTTPGMMQTIQQILACPYQGQIKQLYLEAKVQELVALKLEQLRCASPMQPSGQITLTADDMHRLHQAREILLADIEQPPSLLALARQVGINDYKLKRGFRQVYGTTVFGCLHAQRMVKAQQLLERATLKVADVSQAVGYANPSQFAAAFKRKFGLTPSQYRALHRSVG